VHRTNAAVKGKKMQICSTGCRLQLITPALFILLQVALALHHHHFESFHDNKDSLHSAPAAFYPTHVKQDLSSCLVSDVLGFPPPFARIRNPDSPQAPTTVLVSDPPQSRAPPSPLFC